MLIIRMDYTSFDDFWTPHLGEQGPIAEYVGSLDSGAQEQLRSAVRQASLHGEPDGARSYAAVAWAARGTVPI